MLNTDINVVIQEVLALLSGVRARVLARKAAIRIALE
jgi:hypothetical protein